MIRMRGIVALLLVAAGFGVSYGISERASQLRNDEVETDLKYLPRPEVVRALSLGYSNLASDLYWLRAVTYYGEWRQGAHGIEYFQELVESTIALDPHFVPAYRFGATVLATDLGRMDEGIDLLQRGMQQMPGNWWLPFWAGFLEYTVRSDETKAYEWFQRSGRIPGAPDMPRRFAAFVAGRAGELEVSYELWRFVAETSESPDMRAKALDYMEQLEAAIKGEGPVPEWARPRGRPEEKRSNFVEVEDA